MLRIIDKATRILSTEGLAGLLQRVRQRIKSYHGYCLNEAYDAEFFQFNIADSRPMAEYLAPRIVESLSVKRVIDMGCAAGHWVAAFLSQNIDAVGIEGSTNVRPYILCPDNRILFADLRKPLKFHFQDIDLVISIEVAEHIEARFARTFVKNLVKYKPRYVIMTAAQPGQGGVFHVNEQPAQYWENLFLEQRYVRNSNLENMIAMWVEEGRRESDPPAIMRRCDLNHKGVWIPDWMPGNLLVFVPAVHESMP